jgi:hypothetical protein
MTPTRGLSLAAACALAVVVAAPTVSFATDATSPSLRTHSPVLDRSHHSGHGGGKGHHQHGRHHPHPRHGTANRY